MPPGLRPVFGYPEFSQRVYDAYPTFFGVLPRLADSLNDLSSRQHPNPEPYQKVILNLALLTGVSMTELVTLAGNGFGLGAMKIARTVMESAINAEYLRRFPEQCELYLNWHWIEEHKLLVWVRRHAPELLNEILPEQIERGEREFDRVRAQYLRPDGELRGSWCNLDLGSRAARTDLSGTYKLINPVSSALIHGTFDGLARHFDVNADRHRISFPPSMEYCGESLSGGHRCMLAMVGTLANAFNWVPCNSMERLAEDFHDAWNAGRAGDAGVPEAH
jgi:hypothetical protein